MNVISRISRATVLAMALMVGGCAHEAASVRGPPPCPFPNDGTQSTEILCREPVSNHANVKHILISWKGTAANSDPRAEQRTYAEAQALARDLLRQVGAGTPFDALMVQYSEDPGSAKNASPYEVTTSATFVSTFKTLCLRLQVGESGIVQTQFGLHVIERLD